MIAYKNIFTFYISTLLLLSISTVAFSQKVGVNNDGTDPAAMLHIKKDDANNATVTDLFSLEHTTTAAPAAGIAGGISFKIEDAGASQEQARIDMVLDAVTDAAEEGTLKFSVNSLGTLTEMMRFDGTAGNMGILGATTPSYLFSLGGNAARTIGMERHTTGNTAGNNLRLQAGAAYNVGGPFAGGDLVLSGGIATGTGSSSIAFKTVSAGGAGTTDNAAATKMVLDGNGFLGIGTTTPAAQLTVDGGTGDPSTGKAVVHIRNAGGTDSPALNFAGNYGSGMYFILGTGYTSATPGGLYFFDNVAGTTAAPDNVRRERMLIQPNGFTSIAFEPAAGTAIPTMFQAYHQSVLANNATVSSVLRADHITSGTAAAGFGSSIDYYLEDAGTNNNQAARIDIVWEDAAHGSEDASIRFNTMQAGTLTEAMRIDDNGNVGIGATAPGEKLEINGNVKATTFIATTAGAGAYKYNTASNMTIPDYVFENYFDSNKKNNPEYEMLNLNELENYLKKNKHLPRVPSRESFLKDKGMNMQAVSMLNLEKAEETVLYILELESKVENQNESIEQLIKENEVLQKSFEEKQMKINRLIQNAKK